jgi:pimeloyl-ACP methyl ester carboxylesterase
LPLLIRPDPLSRGWSQNSFGQLADEIALTVFDRSPSGKLSADDPGLGSGDNGCNDRSKLLQDGATATGKSRAIRASDTADSAGAGCIFDPTGALTMILTLLMTVALAAPATEDVPTQFWQIAPEPFAATQPFQKSHPRAVVLIHGLMVYPLSPSLVRQANPHPWQHPDGALVRALSGEFDVYGFSYAQIRPISDIAASPGLIRGVARLKAMDYREIILIGHSAGGLIAREFVEQFPESGVTKVLTVAAPHRGSSLATWSLGVPAVQWPFLRSLTPAAREKAADKLESLPPTIEFCCVVCKLTGFSGDSVVSAASQWPEDLQVQGVPAVVVPAGHKEAVRSEKAVSVITQLARRPIRRWQPEQVQQVREHLFGGSWLFPR